MLEWFTRRTKVTAELCHDHLPESQLNNEDADADELMIVNSLSSQCPALSKLASIIDRVELLILYQNTIRAYHGPPDVIL